MWNMVVSPLTSVTGKFTKVFLGYFCKFDTIPSNRFSNCLYLINNKTYYSKHNFRSETDIKSSISRLFFSFRLKTS